MLYLKQLEKKKRKLNFKKFLKYLILKKIFLMKNYITKEMKYQISALKLFIIIQHILI